jgi:ElaB/YqjD/DUF883 family membrane-anchored ribosome-binding protein
LPIFFFASTAGAFNGKSGHPFYYAHPMRWCAAWHHRTDETFIGCLRYSRASSVNNGNKTRTAMTTRTTKAAAADEIAAIEDLMNDLEKRLRRLSGAAKGEAAGASADVSAFVSESLSNIMDRVRDSAANLGKSVADETSRVGSDAVKRLVDEVEHRPLVMLGIAAGIGFLVGLANRR